MTAENHNTVGAALGPDHFGPSIRMVIKIEAAITAPFVLNPIMKAPHN